MTNTVISLKKSATPGTVPSSLANGELAINYADGKLFYKAANGTIAEISGSGGGGSNNNFATINVAGTLIVADISGDILTITAGDNIVLTPDAGSDSFSIAAPAVNAAFDAANTAQTRANNSLANTTGTFNGDLTISGNLIVQAISANGSVGTAGQVLTSNGSVAYWSTVSGSGGGASVTVANTVPGSASDGDLWFNSEDGSLYVYYGSDSVWVGVSGPPGEPGVDGADGVSGISTGKSIAMAMIFG